MATRKNAASTTKGAAAKAADTTKLTHAEFILKAIVALRKEGYKGIHTVYSGFNTGFKKYYGLDADPIAATKALEAAGKITISPARGGVMLYMAGDAPLSPAQVTLAKMGL